MIWLALPALAAAAYYLLALAAAFGWRRRQPETNSLPPVSILKPMYGADPGLYEAIRSHALQDYPEFEILFGFGDAGDPGVEAVERLQRDFPSLPLHIVIARPDAPNAKVAVLADLSRQARHQILVVNDDDIRATPEYLRSVVAALDDTRTGLVTCLYRAHAGTLPSRIEALGIATEFVPSVLVARQLGVVDFALGSTMALTRETLQKIGGFEILADLLADDYHLGRRVAALGYRIAFAPAVVETGSGDTSWAGLWKHQLRWSRTIRVSRRAGYYGSVITQATIWAIIAVLAGRWTWGAAALASRLITGVVVGGIILQDRSVWRWFWLMPLRDLFGFAVWAGGCFGSTVYWRGRKLHLRSDGRIELKR